MKRTFAEYGRKYTIVVDDAQNVTVTTIFRDRFTGDDEEVRILDGYIEDGKLEASDELDGEMMQEIESRLFDGKAVAA